MYSLAAATIRSYSAGVGLEEGQTVSGPTFTLGGAGGDRAPDHVGIEADDGVAPTHRAALDRFEQEAHRPLAANLEEGRHRRFEVRDQRRPHDLGLAPRVALGECRCLRLDLHG